MNARAQWRLYVLNHVLAGESSAAQAAELLGVSLRQLRRLLAAYRREGVAALVHGNAGRVPANRIPDELRHRVIALAVDTYPGANRAHLADLLGEREGIHLPARSLRRILGEAGLPAARKRRPRRGHVRRERMSAAGLLLQVDGSRHDWLEGRGPWLTLVGGIDDATGEISGAVFREQEDTAGYLEVLSQTARAYGLPVSLYSDRHGIFWKSPATIPTLAEQFAGRRPMTQLGKALEAAQIAWIAARSPQAKGRVERLWGTLQDRLRVELRLAAACTLEDANVVLADYLPRHNQRFRVPARESTPLWRPLDRGPEELFCFRHSRRLERDGTFTLAGSTWALAERSTAFVGARRVIVQERLDGSLWVELEGKPQSVVPAPPPAVALRAQALDRIPGSKAHTPRADHPWKTYSKCHPG